MKRHEAHEAQGVPEVPRSLTTRRIALLGFARTYTDAPFKDESVCIAGMNELYKHIPRWDVWFELHDTGYLGKTARAETPDEPTKHLEWLRAQPAEKPIYMLKRLDDIPASAPYPLDSMIARFGRYFTSTVGYMLAWAICEILQQRADPVVPEPGEWIGLFGIDLASGTEYAQQRPNAEYLVGYARGMGITVEIPDNAAICHADGLYGFEPPPNEDGAVNECFLRTQIGRAQKKQYEHEATMRTLDGVLQLAYTMRHDPQLEASPKSIAFLDYILKTKGDERGQVMADWNAATGCIQGLQVCLQAIELRRRGVYIPERDPFAMTQANTSEAA